MTARVLPGKPGIPLLLLIFACLCASACEAPTDAERCRDIESRLSAEVLSLPASCREDTDCHPVQMHCKSQWSVGAAPPVSVTRLSKQFEDLGCCGSDAVWDGFTPKDPPAVGCTEGPVDAEGAGGPNVCAVRDRITCRGGCRIIEGCPERDTDAWSDHDDGCEAGCELTQQSHPARTQRLLDCVAAQGCASDEVCD